MRCVRFQLRMPVYRMTWQMSSNLAGGTESSDKDEREKGLKKILGLTLTNRDLRFANFRDALLPKPVHVLHRRQVRKLL